VASLKLVLLPGLDGKGELFQPILSLLREHEVKVISLPETGEQNYQKLTSHVKAQLPEQEFLIVAESFSGPIAAELAKEKIPYLKGIIFVATFLSPPNKLLLAVTSALPIKALASLPGASFLSQALFFGNCASKELLGLFQYSVASLPNSILTGRIKAVSLLNFSGTKIELPVAYIRALSDKLVPASKSLEFGRFFGNITIKEIEGPHFLLQTKPKESAAAITEFAKALTSGSI
jgi:pimeloyl-ACP methyl ester carboxylesterase